MLENLDKVPWDKLHDAYGPALKTPANLRAIASSDPDVREAALDELSYTIYHQGTIYAASAAAVPFLLEILATPGIDRTPTLQLLALLATGTSYHEVHGTLDFLKEKASTPEWQQKVCEEKAWVADTRSRIEAGIPLYVHALESGSPGERLAAISLLAVLRDDPRATAAIERTTAAPDPALSSAAILAFGSQENAPPEKLLNLFHAAPTALSRTALALQLMHAMHEQVPPEVPEHLLSELRQPDKEMREAYESLPTARAFLGDLAQAFASGPTSAAEEAFPLVYEQVQASRYPMSTEESLGLLVLAVMLSPPPEGDWSRAALTAEQQQTIRLIARRAWTVNKGTPIVFVNMVDVLRTVGLPGDQNQLRRLLGEPLRHLHATPALLKPKPWWKIW